ncbi:hypothetical protein CONPUDRAFT_131601 [Coniophora puteana RWD-64-598 SS2]|uniref:F-box domain-containing protein n=1 Tax=Coniophora puteana (strain RWD-64-598) TaxID=741705 RepID=A0A5M3M9Z2_CONPW|nr:uncharacterized protein CONPUDRAFT_131601 [Coniophora puteana RWD-64-598 SS2]EIW76068.1 hypothetical protein CONPUDRAFT_131601 [Coniophora puteana RWD-64-598 SS2]
MEHASQKEPSALSLTSLPLDVVYEIFSELTPLDLLHICWTSRELRRVMMSKQSVTVWMSARKVRNDVPACRSDVSEPQWAYLLFGPPICQLCGQDAPGRPNLQLTRRVCMSCLAANTIAEYDIPKHFPEVSAEMEIAKYVPSARTALVGFPPREKGLQYWTGDVQDVVSQLTKLHADVEAGKEGAQVALDDYKASRRTVMRDCLKYGAAGELWLRRDTRDRVALIRI